MSFTFEFGDYDPATVGPGTGGRINVGKYQFLVKDVDEREEGDDVMVTLEVVAAEEKNESMLGRDHVTYLPKGGGGGRRTILFAVATGCVTHEQLAAFSERVKAGEAVTVDWDLSAAIQKSIWAEVELNEYQKKVFDEETGKETEETKSSHRIGFKIFEVGDKRAKGYPINESAVPQEAAFDF